MNAFMLWAKEKRVEMMKQGLQVAEVSQVNLSQVHLKQNNQLILLQALSEQWKRLGEEEKRHYYREQEHLKELHKLQHPDYKYSPKMVRPSSLSAPAPSPPPVSPNQPPEDLEPNQPPPIQVLELCKSLNNFNFFCLRCRGLSLSCATNPSSYPSLDHL